MKVAMVDPSLFTIPYDRALVDRLRAGGHFVRWFGRPLRDWERELAEGAAVEEFFYVRTEPLKARLGKRLGIWMKAFGHLSSMLAFQRLMIRWKPDVIHFQWFPVPALDNFFTRRLGKIAPVVATVHDSRPFNSNPSSRLQRWDAYRVLQCCDHLIVHTDSAIEKLVEVGIDRSRVTRIPHGLLANGDGKEEQKAAKDKVTFVQFGTVKPYKGVDVLLQATAMIEETVRNSLSIVVAGSPSFDVSELIALRRQLGLEGIVDFDFRRYTDREMSELFQRADVMLYPYREIEASGVLLASMQYGRAVIASRLGVFEEMIADGVHGRLVPPGDAMALSLAIAELALDPKKRALMGLNMAQLANDVPSWTEIGAMTVRAYQTARMRSIASTEHPTTCWEEPWDERRLE
jgi:glycosyltransferase involved in cell wall biosynthesis